MTLPAGDRSPAAAGVARGAGRARPSGGEARAVTAVLVALALLRAATAFLPSMWAWGLDAQRFLAPLPAWLPWLALALPLLPRVGAALAPRLDRAGDGLGGALASWLVALAAVVLVLSLPDRAWFIGDFMLRRGAVETGALPRDFIQTLPLERMIELDLPRGLRAATGIDPDLVTRAVEALAAAALGALAVRLTREWGLRGGAALVAAATIVCGGWLTCFTGLGKPAALLCVLTAAALLGATRLARTGQGGVLLGGSVAAAFLLHRSGLALAPLWLAALVPAFRGHGDPAGRPGLGLGTAAWLPALALVIVAPALWRILTEFDLPRHLLPAGATGAGALALAVAPLHLLDLANLLVFQTPALVVALALAARREPAGAQGVAARLSTWCALSFVPLLLFVHPIQGVFRDLDVFACAGLAAALFAAERIGRAIAAGRLRPWLAPALVAAVVAPALQWLLHFHDPARGFARARAAAVEAPARSQDERARLWDALAYRAFRDRQWDRAVEACEQSARRAPHPRALTMLAIARTYTGDYRGAESLYVALATRDPGDPLGWLGLAGVSLRLGDSLWSARAMARLESYPRGGREAGLIHRHLRAFPVVWPASAGPPPP